MKDPLWAALYLCIFIASAAALHNQVVKRKQAVKRIPYRYSSIPPGNHRIRLLRLIPSEDETAAIKCQLFNYSLARGKQAHRYEALSYVWGDRNETVPIFIGEHVLLIKASLYAALVHLRDCSFERIMWVDAVCINQENEKEKEQQIPFMAEIYSQASRVVVWLGEAASNSDLALEKIRVAGYKKSEHSLNDKLIQEAVLELLKRPWFKRIWILQEVAAARHVLIMCGATEIDGYAFCLGVDSLKELYPTELQSLIRSVAYLIRGAIFRPSYEISRLGRGSQDTCPLGELVDMYHTHKASRRHDKVYALLGMSSDGLSKVDLRPNYKVPWEELLQRLARSLLCEKISVETWGDKEIAIINTKGSILGKVSSVQSGALDGKQSVDVILKNIPGQPRYMGEWKAHWTLQVSAKSVQEGDLICLLQGASKPTIVRPCHDFLAIIIVAATPPENIQSKGKDIKWPKIPSSEEFFTRDFLLVWDWEKSPKKLQDLEEYESLVQANNWLPKHSKTELESRLDKATRTWNVALILGDLKEYEEAQKRFREAAEDYKMAFAEEDSYTLGSQYGQTPLWWATENGYDVVVNLILAQDGINPDVKDSYGQTPLSRAARNGHEAIVKLLLETGKVEVDSKNSYGRTPLSWAAENGHEAIVKLLKLHLNVFQELT